MRARMAGQADRRGRCSQPFHNSSPDAGPMASALTASATFTTGIVALIMQLNITPSWGQPVCVAPGCNPTVTDGHANTAGGSGALSNLVTGASFNTAFGFSVLSSNTSGDGNTAY